MYAIRSYYGNLSLASIKRKTDKKLPQYLDANDTDIFLFSEAEDLVPEFKKKVDGSFIQDASGRYVIRENLSQDNQFLIRYYRPRIEGLFARIERWQDKTTHRFKWKVIVITSYSIHYTKLYDPHPRVPDPERRPELPHRPERLETQRTKAFQGWGKQGCTPGWCPGCRQLNA